MAPRSLAAALVALSALVAGCTGAPPAGSGGGSHGPGTEPGPEGPTEVRMVGARCGQCFEPLEVTVLADQPVRWIGDSGSHTVTFQRAVNGTAGAGPDSGNLDEGQAWEVAFPEPGRYEYRCRYHSSGFGAGKGMVGAIVVA